MSVQAITWAFACDQVTDPIETLVLITLANYADDFGVCWPSQTTLTRECRCSTRKLQYALKALAARGLIARYERRRPNGSRRSDAVVLIGFAQRKPLECVDHPVLAGQHLVPDPAPDAGNLHDVRPDKAHDVRLDPAPRAPLEPSIEPSGTTTKAATSDPEAACLEAAGPGLEEGQETIGETRAVIGRWLEEGLDLEADILPVIAERTGKPRARPIRSWDYFTEAIRAARRRRLAQTKRAPPCDEPAPEPVNPDRVVERMADWINSGKHVPPSAVSNTLRNELLARGLVTEAALRRLQIY